ncbi:hypothetical protein MXB_736 [Myxobolus squamalis]|nr:hypothetical protein MXB_736 [Myxobolus squamalis]
MNERKRLLMSPKSHKSFTNEPPIYVEDIIPIEYDYRDDKVISHVKNQYSCGSGYAFSAVAAIESAFALETGNIPDLSEQEILSCSKKYGNYGCDGGIPELAFEYCMVKGLSTTIKYPYTAKVFFIYFLRKDAKCARKNPSNAFKLEGYKRLTLGDEQNLLRALFLVGPISITLNARHNEFIFYKSGVINIEACSNEFFDHGALAVGYSLTDNPYLIAKNSFGPNWGEDGYFRIELFNNNMCGIASYATYPIPLI